MTPRRERRVRGHHDRPGLVSGSQPADPSGRRVERHQVGRPRSGCPQRDRLVGLAHSWWADHHDVLGPDDERRGRQVSDQLLRGCGQDHGVEVGQCLDLGEVGSAIRSRVPLAVLEAT